MNIFSHITTLDIVGLLIALVAMVGIAEYVRRFRHNPVNIVGSRKIFFTASTILLIICLVSLGVKIGSGGLNLSLEFTGGTMMEVGFEDKSITQEKISQEIMSFSEQLKQKTGIGLKHPVIQMVSNTKTAGASASMRNATLTLNRKDGQNLTNDLKGLEGALAELFFNAKVIKIDTAEPKEAVVHFQVEEKDGMFGVSTPVDSNKDTTSGNEKGALYFMDEDALVKAVTTFDETLNISSITVGELESADAAAKVTYKIAMIRIVKEDRHNLNTTEVNTLAADLKARFGNIYIFKNESIGPSVGRELAQKAFLAILIALVLQLVYISIRFNGQSRYGVAADLALLHDVTVMFGIYALVGRELDSPFVAALLTVIGYSVMDSIIIFDRIRENLKLMPNETYEKVVNLSVNQTMTRSINTLLTVLITLISLYFFGGETLQNFAFALIVGCSVGAYSSIFLAAPIVCVIDEKVKAQKREMAELKRKEREEIMKSRAAKKSSKSESTSEESLSPVEKGAKKGSSVKYKKRLKKKGSSPDSGK